MLTAAFQTHPKTLSRWNPSFCKNSYDQPISSTHEVQLNKPNPQTFLLSWHPFINESCNQPRLSPSINLFELKKTKKNPPHYRMPFQKLPAITAFAECCKSYRLSSPIEPNHSYHHHTLSTRPTYLSRLLNLLYYICCAKCLQRTDIWRTAWIQKLAIKNTYPKCPIDLPLSMTLTWVKRGMHVVLSNSELRMSDP